MASHLTSPTFFWRSCGDPSAAWFLVWLPLLLLALDNGSSLGSAMARLLAVLLVAGLIWARGLGPSGAWPERAFVCVWAATWAGALGTLVTAGGWPTSILGSLSLFVALLIGAGWLGWACQMRHELRTAFAGGPQLGHPGETPATSWTIATVWLVAMSLFALALVSSNAHWGDAVALTFGVGGFTMFQRGSLRPPEPIGD